MDYKVTYMYFGTEHEILMQDQENIAECIFNFIEDQKKGCRIIKIEEK